MSANTNADVAVMVTKLQELALQIDPCFVGGPDTVLLNDVAAEITRLFALLEERTEALRKIVAPYDRDGCMMGERYADAVWIAKAAISTEDK